MREIKFRAWCVAGMFDVNDLYFDKGQAELSDGDLRSLKSIELLQFTGLKDKNGKEIYEGDILMDKYGVLWTVHFVMGKFSIFCDTKNLLKSVGEKRNIKLTEDEQTAKDLDAWWVGLKIIGNKFENPGLLKD